MSSFTKKEQIVILIVVLFMISVMGIKFILDGLNTKEEPYALVNNPNENLNIKVEDERHEESSIIMVYISGQVYSPGVYELVKGDRVKDVVSLAGGLTKEADINNINLAKKISDEEKIYIPKTGEQDVNIQISNDSITSNEQKGSKININICSSSELVSLPGIGDVIASRIIEYRKTTPFSKIEELKNVSGIGDKKYDGIKELITVN